MMRMTISEHPINTLQGEPTSLADFQGKALLLVNVASKCGLTPQYTGLEQLQSTYEDQGFSVVGFPCNQFGGQEPGTAEEIETFCSVTYGVTFPSWRRSRSTATTATRSTPSSPRSPTVRATPRDPLELREVPRLARGRHRGPLLPLVTPEDPTLVAAIEEQLPG